MQREGKPLGQKKIKRGQAETVAASAGNHAVQEIIVRVPRDAVVGEPLFDEQEPVEGRDDLARTSFLPECIAKLPGQLADFLFDGGGIDGHAGQVCPYRGRDMDEGLPEGDLFVRQNGVSGQAIGAVPVRRCLMPYEFGVSRNRTGG